MTPQAPVRRVAILAPMRSELQPLVRRLGLRRPRVGQGGLWSGAVGLVEVVATITGVGTQAASRAAERVLDSTAVEALFVVGVAGGIGPSVGIGALVGPAVV